MRDGYLDIAQLREGDTIATVQTSDVLTPFDATLREELLSKMVARLSTDMP